MGKKLLPLVLLMVASVTVGCRRGGGGPDQGAIAASSTLAPTPADAASDTPSAASDTVPALSDAFGAGELEAVVVPPVGWRADPVKRSRNHAHQVWISPSRRTAYGVIRMNLPLPFIGPDLILPRFLDEMRRTEGEARLLGRKNDSSLNGIRFVAEGGQYRLRANMVSRGFRAWTVYAGTLRAQPEAPDELRIAEAAREQTRIGTTRLRSKNR